MHGSGAADGLRRPAHRHRTFAVVLLHPGGRTVRHGQTGSDDRRPPGESQRLGSRGLRLTPHLDRGLRQLPRVPGRRRGGGSDGRRTSDRTRAARQPRRGLPFALRQEGRGGAPRLLLRAAEGLRRQGRADSHRTGRIPPLYLPGDGGGEPDLQHRDAHGRKRPGARRVGDLHRRRTYRGLGGDRARLCRHLPDRRHGDNVFQRRTRRRACGLGRVQRRANLRGGAQPHRRRSRALPAFRHPRASAGGAEDRPVVHVGGERAAEPRKGGRQERFRPGAPRGERHVGRGARPASRRGRPAR